MTKMVLTSEVTYILYCPLAFFSMCSHLQSPFHTSPIAFPEQVVAFLKLGPYILIQQGRLDVIQSTLQPPHNSAFDITIPPKQEKPPINTFGNMSLHSVNRRCTFSLPRLSGLPDNPFKTAVASLTLRGRLGSSLRNVFYTEQQSQPDQLPFPPSQDFHRVHHRYKK